jgi:hypothetical protein
VAVWVRATPGSNAFLLLSFGVGPPVALPGIEGTFDLDLPSTLLLHAGTCDSFEMTASRLVVPNDPGRDGIDPYFQAYVDAPGDGWRKKFTKRLKRQIRKIFDKWNGCKDERNRCFTACQQSLPSIVDRCAKSELYKLYWGPSAYAQAVWQCIQSQVFACSEKCPWEYARCMLR